MDSGCSNKEKKVELLSKFKQVNIQERDLILALLVILAVHVLLDVLVILAVFVDSR